MTLSDLPNPGKHRFWHGVHYPNSVKTPLVLELREKTNGSAPTILSFSRLIAKQPTIADKKMILEAASEVLIRAAAVDDYTGILKEND